MSKGKREGLVFDIQRYSINDGPGIRTVVFLKGCSLNCIWCANPESIKQESELLMLPEKCIGCKRCVNICPKRAISIDKIGGIITDSDLCDLCGKCTDVCPTEARILYGNKMTAEEVLKVVSRDIPFYRNSGGGVTISGGEPGMQPDFVETLIKFLDDRGIRTAIETNGYMNEKVFSRLIAGVDLVLFDFKHIDPRKHLKYTGKDNKMIVKNLKSISLAIHDDQARPELIIRIPLIPKHNTELDKLQETASFLESLRAVKEVHLLPYHRLGVLKYKRIGLKYSLEDLGVMSKTEAKKFKKIFQEQGLTVKIIS